MIFREPTVWPSHRRWPRIGGPTSVIWCRRGRMAAGPALRRGWHGGPGGEADRGVLRFDAVAPWSSVGRVARRTGHPLPERPVHGGGRRRGERGVRDRDGHEAGR